MSPEIVRAALREASAESFAPMFIATPRQVDADRGYTGWSQSELVTFVERVSKEEGYDGPVLFARDHGGPYQSVRDRDEADIDLSTAMEFARELFYDDLEAGFDILHVDATEDPTIEGTLNLDEVARRTVELITDIENQRMDKERDEVYYEIGTEEISGGMTEPDDFRRYIRQVRHRLREKNVSVMDRIIFIVGQVGTTMRIDMTNDFTPQKAQKLVDIADKNDLFLKTHYTDWLDNSTLEQFPELGIGGANVGPEFAAAIVEALAELERKETEVLDTPVENGSQFMDTLKEHAVQDAPWEKFAPSSISNEEISEFAENNRENIAKCVGRYVLTNQDVVDARMDLYNTIEDRTSIDPDQFLIERVQSSIDRYVQAFNLSGTSVEYSEV